MIEYISGKMVKARYIIILLVLLISVVSCQDHEPNVNNNAGPDDTLLVGAWNNTKIEEWYEYADNSQKYNYQDVNEEFIDYIFSIYGTGIGNKRLFKTENRNEIRFTYTLYNSSLLLEDKEGSLGTFEVVELTPTKMTLKQVFNDHINGYDYKVYLFSYQKE